MSIKVAFFSRYERLGASSRYRFIQYFEIYKRNGIEPILLPFYSDTYLKRRYTKKNTVIHIIFAYIRRFIQIITSKKRYPVVVLEYELLPYLPRIIEKLALKWIGSPYVVEYDDAVFTRYESKKMWPLRRKIPGLLQNSSLVIAGSNYLCEQLATRGAKKTVIVPTSVSNQKLHDRTEKNNICTLVWIGSNTTAQYINQISKALQPLLKNSVRLMVIGAGQWRFDGNENVIYKDWKENEEAKLLSECDIGIMPLPDTDWARGKCGLKIIQYMMAGLPVVASNVGANTEIITSGVDGFLASNEKEWYEYLSDLISKPQQRRKMGENGRQKALDVYCVENNAEKIMNLYLGEIRDDRSEIKSLRQGLKFEGRKK